MKPIEKRKHHYVPQFLLRNFSIEGRDTLFAFDKLLGSRFPVAVSDAAAEKEYNTFLSSGRVECAEDTFTTIENGAAQVVRSLVRQRHLKEVSEAERIALARLAAAQMLRSRSYRAAYDQIGQIVRRLAEEEGTPEFKRWVGEANPEEDKRALLENIGESIDNFVPYLEKKDLVLFTAPEHYPLYIGDSPIARTNTLNRSELRGTSGLASPGVEIYLPLSPTLVLGFMCPTIKR